MNLPGPVIAYPTSGPLSRFPHLPSPKESSMEIIPELSDSIMHLAAHIIREAIRAGRQGK